MIDKNLNEGCWYLKLLHVSLLQSNIKSDTFVWTSTACHLPFLRITRCQSKTCNENESQEHEKFVHCPLRPSKKNSRLSSKAFTKQSSSCKIQWRGKEQKDCTFHATKRLSCGMQKKNRTNKKKDWKVSEEKFAYPVPYSSLKQLHQRRGWLEMKCYNFVVILKNNKQDSELKGLRYPKLQSIIHSVFCQFRDISSYLFIAHVRKRWHLKIDWRIEVFSKYTRRLSFLNFCQTKHFITELSS